MLTVSSAPPAWWEDSSGAACSGERALACLGTVVTGAGPVAVHVGDMADNKTM